MQRLAVLCSFTVMCCLVGCQAGNIMLYDTVSAEGRAEPNMLQRSPADTEFPALEFADLPPAGEVPHLAEVQPRRVIYTGRFAILSADVEAALSAAKTMAERMGGFMQRMTGQSIVVRVPAEKFDSAVAELEKLGTVIHRDVTAQDVTEEYLDLELRLANARALLEKLHGLLAKAQSVKDALEVEKELARVRTEVEQLEGKLNRLKSQVAMATLSVDFRAMEAAPRELQTTLPFAWLRTLGLDSLLSFDN